MEEDAADSLLYLFSMASTGLSSRVDQPRILRLAQGGRPRKIPAVSIENSKANNLDSHLIQVWESSGNGPASFFMLTRGTMSQHLILWFSSEGLVFHQQRSREPTT